MNISDRIVKTTIRELHLSLPSMLADYYHDISLVIELRVKEAPLFINLGMLDGTFRKASTLENAVFNLSREAKGDIRRALAYYDLGSLTFTMIISAIESTIAADIIRDLQQV